MRYFAHIYTGELDNGRPVINIFTEDGQWTAKYLLNTDHLLYALNTLRSHGWTVFANIKRKRTDYHIVEVAEPA